MSRSYVDIKRGLWGLNRRNWRRISPDFHVSPFNLLSGLPAFFSRTSRRIRSIPFPFLFFSWFSIHSSPRGCFSSSLRPWRFDHGDDNFPRDSNGRSLDAFLLDAACVRLWIYVKRQQTKGTFSKSAVNKLRDSRTGSFRYSILHTAASSILLSNLYSQFSTLFPLSLLSLLLLDLRFGGDGWKWRYLNWSVAELEVEDGLVWLIVIDCRCGDFGGYSFFAIPFASFSTKHSTLYSYPRQRL